MITLGIIGAENSHSFKIGKLCNVLKKVPMRATHLWGETTEFARVSAEKGGIPNIVRHWKEMLGQVDGVMIAHRDGKHHYEAAKFFIEHRVPTFVDKPLTTNLVKAKELLVLATRRKTPVCTFSAVPIQASFQKFAATVARTGNLIALNSSGPVDIDSKYGGIFFYGIHQVDAIVELMGTEARTAHLQRHGKNGVATIFFSNDRVATMNCIAEGGVFHWQACTDKGVVISPRDDDPNIYLGSAKIIHRLIRDGEVPWSRSRMLAPVAILEALQKSFKSGKPEKVGRV